MSGRNCAYGLYFQYLVSLGFLLDALDKPECLRIRVDPGDEDDAGPDCTLQIVDLDVVRSDGVRAVVAQIKGAINHETASPITAPNLADWFSKLVASGASQSYQVVTNRRLTEPAQRIADALESGDLAALQHAWPDARASDFQDEILSCGLMKCRVLRETRSTGELLSALRARIKGLRIRSRQGTGDESAGLLTIYLVGQILYYGSGAHPDLITVEQAKQWLHVAPEDLARCIQRYDWGIPIGVPFPGTMIRTEKLYELTEFFKRPRANFRDNRLVVVHGLSGLGKSTLSAQFACDYADHYDFIWWVDCESESSIDKSLRSLEASIPGLEWGDDGASLRDLPVALSKFAGRWLVVADNVYRSDLVTPWLPTTGCGDVIVTTVDGTLMPHEHRIALDEGFTVEESRGFLSEKLPAMRAHSHLLDELADTLEHWPLALAMAAAYLINAQRDLRGTPPRQLQKFRSAIIRAASAVDDRRYPRTLAAAISMVLGQVRERAAAHPFVYGHDVGELAINGLVSAAYFAESDIPVEILWASAFACSNDDEVGQAEIVSDAVITLLRSGSVVQRTQLIHELSRDNPFRDRITINQITQEVIRSEIEAENPESLAQFLIELCGRVDQTLRPAVQNDEFSTIAALCNHGEQIARHGKRLEALGPELAALHGNLALALEKNGRYRDAIRFLEDELAMLDSITVEPTLMKIKTLIQLSHVVIQAGRSFEEILERIRETVEVAECFEPVTPYEQEDLAHNWFNIQSIVDGLRKHQDDPSVVAFRARVRQNAELRPPRSKDPYKAGTIECLVEIGKLSELMRLNGYDLEVIRRSRIAFDRCPDQRAKVQLLGLQIEAHARSGDTISVMNGMRELELFAQPMNAFVDTVVDALQNVGLAIAWSLDSSVEYVYVLRLLLRQSGSSQMRV